MKKKTETLVDVFDSTALGLGSKRMTKRQAELVHRFEKAFDAEMKPVNDAAYALCLEIEKLPGSEQQTKISLMASNLRQSLERIPVGMDKEP